MKKSTQQKVFNYITNNVLLVGLLSVVVAEIRRGLFAGHEHLATLIAMGITLIIGTNQILRIGNKIDDMTRPVKTTLLDVTEAYERAIERARNAKRELLAVHNWTLGYQAPKTGEADRRKYFSTLLDIAIERKLKYKRIIQLPSSGTAATTNPLLLEIRKCAEATKESQYRIQVRGCEPLYLVNFLLIDGEDIFIQVDNRDEQTGRYEFNRCIAIEDGTGDVVSAFQTIFEELEGRSKLMEPQEFDPFIQPP